MSQKKPKGRPKKPANEKLEQFSVRLAPDYKFMLEVFAKAEGLSLSGSVDLAVSTLIKESKIGDQPLIEVGISAVKYLLGQFLDQEGNGARGMEDIRRAQDAALSVMADEYGKLVVFPPQVLSDEEQYFVAVVKHLGIPYCLGRFGHVHAFAGLCFDTLTPVAEAAHLFIHTEESRKAAEASVLAREDADSRESAATAESSELPARRIGNSPQTLPGIDVKAGMSKGFLEAAKQTENPEAGKGPRTRKKYPR